MYDFEVSVTLLWTQNEKRLFPGPRQWSLGSVYKQTTRSLEALHLHRGDRPPGQTSVRGKNTSLRLRLSASSLQEFSFILPSPA